MQPATAHYEDTSLSLLARTPALAKPERGISNEPWNAMRLEMERRLAGLRDWRLSWWQHWAMIAANILPRRYHWLITPNAMNRGLPINQAIVDPTATQALRVCTAGMVNGLMSPSRPWFRLKPSTTGVTVTRDMQVWFDEVEHRIYAIMAGSNFYDAITQMFQDLILFGTAPMIIYEDREDIIRCYNPCAGEYYLASGSDGRVNTFYRTFTFTTWQIVQMFGLKNVGTEVQQLWQTKGAALEQEQVVAHCIEPNFAASMDSMQPKLGVVPGNFPIREYYWLWGKSSLQPLSVRGFPEMPGIYPRWETTSNDAYGRSPGMDALPDILQLNQMTRRFAEAVEKLVRPPMLASVSMKNEPSSILPGSVTYSADTSKDGYRPVWEVDPKVQEMAAWIKDIEVRIQRWFYNDLFQMMAQIEGVQPRNEMEIAERRGEKLTQLGPVSEKIQNEGASPAIRRIVGIMKRRGLLPPMPESLKRVPVEIEYVSQIALAQRATTTASMERGVRIAAQLSQIYPDKPATDNIDPDVLWRSYAERIGFPNRPTRGEDEVGAMRKERAQAQAKAAKAQETTALATDTLPAVAGAARDVAEIDTGGGLNAFQIMAGQGGAGEGPVGLPQ